MNTFEKYLCEASFGRVLQHLKKGDPLLFISGDRAENLPAENKRNYSELKRLVGLAGFGYNRIKGGYIEKSGGAVDSESSLLVIGTPEREKELFNLGMSIGKKFHQDSILFVGSDGNAFFVSTSNDSFVGQIGAKFKLGKPTLDGIEDFYTKIGHRQFKFKSLEEGVQHNPDLREQQMSEWFKRDLKVLGENILDKWEVYPLVLTEGSLSRLFRHFKDGNALAVVTASRKKATPAENKKNNNELRGFVRNADFGFSKVEGSYPEEQENGETVQVTEDSTIIFGQKPEDEKALKNLAVSLGKRYNQDSVLFKYNDGRVVLIYCRDKKEQKLAGDFHPQKLGDYMSKYKGKTFVIESLDESIDYEPPVNGMSQWARKLWRDKLNKDSDEDPIEKYWN
jgi:hypothetical protein